MDERYRSMASDLISKGFKPEGDPDRWFSSDRASIPSDMLGIQIPRYQPGLPTSFLKAIIQTYYGMELVRSDDLDEALPYFKRAVSLCPSEETFQKNLDIFKDHLSSSPMERAGSIDGKGPSGQRKPRTSWDEVRSDWAERENELGSKMLEKGEFLKAYHHFDRAEQLNPDERKYHLDRKRSLDLLKERYGPE
jgi:tetratricopeptide (TPR) repeat protein